MAKIRKETKDGKIINMIYLTEKETIKVKEMHNFNKTVTIENILSEYRNDEEYKNDSEEELMQFACEEQYDRKKDFRIIGNTIRIETNGQWYSEDKEAIK